MTTFEKFIHDWRQQNMNVTAHTDKKFIDGASTQQGLASELIAVLQRIIMHPDVVTITDRHGNALTHITLFSERLTDGSTAQTAELHFEE